jgi:hypothetical protein
VSFSIISFPAAIQATDGLWSCFEERKCAIEHQFVKL